MNTEIEEVKLNTIKEDEVHKMPKVLYMIWFVGFLNGLSLMILLYSLAYGFMKYFWIGLFIFIVTIPPTEKQIAFRNKLLKGITKR